MKAQDTKRVADVPKTKECVVRLSETPSDCVEEEDGEEGGGAVVDDWPGGEQRSDARYVGLVGRPGTVPLCCSVSRIMGWLSPVVAVCCPDVKFADFLSNN